ncbi:kinase-like protein [Calocera viscosa TUFC12733]|uniref:non-specific serine/threonine protein kinase n=1 Tax=Calocera viscosa (strain TUFC12733) TaxID=1330018 RepID=A0A167QFT3_CALVF|nr:kinase-like protein [Calocera viscosa TUFC12733]
MLDYATAEVLSDRDWLGKGASGTVLTCILQMGATMIEAALKESRVSMRVQKTTLKHEALLLQALQDTAFVPRLYAYGRLPHYEYIAMEKCENWFARDAKLPMEMPQVFDLAFEMIDVLEELHKRDILHGDIKPQNILLRPARAGRPAHIVLCDFGLSRSLASASTQEGKRTIGTRDWTSLASHAYKPLGAGHDLEMLAYMLLYLLRGNLPWKFKARTLAQLRSQYLHLAQVKAAWSGQALGAGYPPIFGVLVDYARNLPPTEMPRYDTIRQALQRSRQEVDQDGLTYDEQLLWQTTNTDTAQEDVSSLPTLTDQDDPVIDPTVDWMTVMTPSPGYPPPSNSRDGYMDEFEEPQGERDPSLSLPEGVSGQLTEVWNLISVKDPFLLS